MGRHCPHRVGDPSRPPRGGCVRQLHWPTQSRAVDRPGRRRRDRCTDVAASPLPRCPTTAPRRSAALAGQAVVAVRSSRRCTRPNGRASALHPHRPPTAPLAPLPFSTPGPSIRGPPRRLPSLSPPPPPATIHLSPPCHRTRVAVTRGIERGGEVWGRRGGGMAGWREVGSRAALRDSYRAYRRTRASRKGGSEGGRVRGRWGTGGEQQRTSGSGGAWDGPRQQAQRPLNGGGWGDAELDRG